MAFLTVFHLCQADRLANVIKTNPGLPGKRYRSFRRRIWLFLTFAPPNDRINRDNINIYI